MIRQVNVVVGLPVQTVRYQVNAKRCVRNQSDLFPTRIRHFGGQISEILVLDLPALSTRPPPANAS